MPASQAGRRGFESHRPLQINNPGPFVGGLGFFFRMRMGRTLRCFCPIAWPIFRASAIGPSPAPSANPWRRKAPRVFLWVFQVNARLISSIGRYGWLAHRPDGSDIISWNFPARIRLPMAIYPSSYLLSRLEVDWEVGCHSVEMCGLDERGFRGIMSN